MNLKVATKIEIKDSPGKGYGVFATENIEENEIIEECHLLTVFERHDPSIILSYYIFKWPKIDDWKEAVIPLGYGCIYNHSDNPNAIWQEHPTLKAFQFISNRKISIGEEICTYYGGPKYWDSKPDKIELK